MVPSYLQELLELYKPTRILRSGKKFFLKLQPYKLKSYGYRAFSVCAPQLWNALPPELKESKIQKAPQNISFEEGFFKQIM